MTRLPRPVLVWAANLVVPGTGLVLVNRLVLGVLAGVAWLAAAGGCLVTAAVWPDRVAPRTAVGLGLAAAAAYALAQGLLAWAYGSARRHARGEVRDEMFRSALSAYLAGRLDEAEALCRTLLHLDPDDVEATLQLASIARRRGDAAVARRRLRRARYLDDERRWDFEIGRELAALEAPAASPPAPA